MKCSKCGSENVQIQAVNEVKLVRHGCLYWLFIGCWLEPLKFLLFGIFALLFRKGKTVKNKVKGYAVCQHCGHRWKV